MPEKWKFEKPAGDLNYDSGDRKTGNCPISAGHFFSSMLSIINEIMALINSNLSIFYTFEST